MSFAITIYSFIFQFNIIEKSEGIPPFQAAIYGVLAVPLHSKVHSCRGYRNYTIYFLQFYNDQQAMENSPSLPTSSEPPLLPLLESLSTRFEHSFEDSEEELDEDRCYLMEIEQLKRENNFLKKKLAELSKRHSSLSPAIGKRKSLPAHIKPPEHITALPEQNYLVTFFDEVTRLLESFSTLFRVDPGTALREQLQQEQAHFAELTAFGTGDLNRRLGRMLLEPEETRYGALLELFEGYYRETTDKSKALKGKVEQLTTQAIELGKQMAERIRVREKVKGSRILSSFHEQSQNLDEFSILKSSFVKSTCTDSLDLSGCRNLLGRDKMFENIF